MKNVFKNRLVGIICLCIISLFSVAYFILQFILSYEADNNILMISGVVLALEFILLAYSLKSKMNPFFQIVPMLIVFGVLVSAVNSTICFDKVMRSIPKYTDCVVYSDESNGGSYSEYYFGGEESGNQLTSNILSKSTYFKKVNSNISSIKNYLSIFTKKISNLGNEIQYSFKTELIDKDDYYYITPNSNNEEFTVYYCDISSRTVYYISK